VSGHRPTVAVVDLRQIAKNFKILKSAAAEGAFVCPMVKANAYGHGDVAVAKKLRSSGASNLGVGLIEEGLKLRESGDDGTILHFGMFDLVGAEVMAERDITPVISSREDLELWIQAVHAQAGWRKGTAGFHLKVNTGMNRLGFAPAEVAATALRIREVQDLVHLEGVAQHFSNGEDFGLLNGRSEEQMLCFRKAVADIRGAGLTGFKLHVANSSATCAIGELRKQHPGDTSLDDLGIRPGISLYGVEPETWAGKIGVQPALQFQSRIVLVQDVRQGSRVSYGGRWQAPRDSRIGVIPCGYADGYRRGLNVEGKSVVIVAGKRVPVVGTICMDYFMCDLTDVQGAAIGDLVTLIGTTAPTGKPSDSAVSITASELGRLVHTIPYEIFTGISERVPRVYVDDAPSQGVISKE
jgi:alanine racemase